MSKILSRPQKEKMIAGVCAGFAEYMNLDISLVRLLFVAITLITAIFPMCLFYIIAWIIIPSDTDLHITKKDE